MYDTIWDRLEAWLAEHTAAEQLGIMALAGVTVFAIIVWVTI
jgi:hypothetical protein